MIAVLQRVTQASLRIGGEEHCRIATGLVVLLGLEKGDELSNGKRLLDKLLSYRVFADEAGRMNLSVTDINAELMLVSQFTLAADTSKGLRPGFSLAMPPQEAEPLYEQLVAYARQQHPKIVTGQFGADMKVALENDGPVTFMLRA